MQLHIITVFFSIPVVYIKEEPHNGAVEDMNSSLNENELNSDAFDMNSLFMKEEPNNGAFDDMNSLIKEGPNDIAFIDMNSSLIKKEPNNATFDDMNLSVIKEDNSSKVLILEKQNQIIGTNISKDKFVIKEEPVEDEMVSKC